VIRSIVASLHSMLYKLWAAVWKKSFQKSKNQCRGWSRRVLCSHC